jgi:S-adenosylmethionine:tRNA ribosyltransferase-isomerase
VKAAQRPRTHARDTRLLAVDTASGALSDVTIADLPSLLVPGDLVVLNDAATLPASLHCVGPGGASVELRLTAWLAEPSRALVVAFGAGDWRTPTEHRAPPPPLLPGDRLVAGDLVAVISRTSLVSPRLFEVRLWSRRGDVLAALYAAGRPVQYSYAAGDVPLALVQTSLAARPWAFECPSASRLLTVEVLTALRRRGVGLATLTHAAGLSATGDESLDRILPLRERFDVPDRTVAAIHATRARGRRVIAAGTTVVRALEGQAARHDGELVAGAGETHLRLGPASERRWVDGILTGMHEPGTSHHDLLRAFASAELLARAHARAESAGYLAHELGDGMLLTAGAPS